MQYIRKVLIILAIATLFVFCAGKSWAQYPGMRAVYSNMARQQQQQSMQNQMAMMGRMNGGRAMLYNPEYAFEVVLKDSTKKQVYSMLYNDTTLHKNYLLVVNKKYPKSDTAHRFQKIYPDQTLQISRLDYYDKAIKGVANDSCWLFKTISGPITAYSYLSEQSGPNFNPGTIVCIQLNDGPIVKYNEDNLKQMVGDDADALENIQKKNYYKAIKKYNSHAEKAAKK